MQKGAVLDQTREYRYLLKRQWGGNDENFVNFVLLNPSTADQDKDDPTVKACMKFAKNWGYDGMWVTNLFALRATDPKKLKIVEDPVGKDNDSYLEQYARKGAIVVLAWGGAGNFLNRGEEVIKLLSKIKPLHCIKNLKSGAPQHPLYINQDSKFIKFST
jgi:hypothetical protein